MTAFQRLFAAYARNLMARSFAGVHLRGAPPGPGTPVVYVLNHASWWDAITVFLISREDPHGPHVALMSEPGLRAFPFFARLGALPVPADRARMVPMFRDLVRRAKAGERIWIFPQGEQRHPDIEPLGIARGAGALAGMIAPCRVVPVALRYELARHQHPELFVSLGAAVEVERALSVEDVERLLGSELARLRADLVAGRLEGFRTLIAGQVAVGDRWLRFKRAVGL